MRSALSEIAVEQPRDLLHALKLMQTAKGAARPTPIAGGTDLLVYLNAGGFESKRFVDLWGLRELRGIRVGPTSATLGANTTFSEIREHANLRARFPALVAAAAEVGARQIQNRATVAGNIANGSPAGDSLPALLALDAAVEARTAGDSFTVPFAQLYRGYRQLALEPGALIVAVTLPFTPPRSRQFFRKVGTRRAQSISKVVMAGVLRLDRAGRTDHVRIAYGSVAPTTRRAERAEHAVMGHPITDETIVRARTALARDIAPIDDIRSDREYRETVAGNLLDQFLRSAGARSAR